MRNEILAERGPMCENCGVRRWSELHHCLVHDSKQFHQKVTCMENLMAVCRHCHSHLNGHEVRVGFAKKQIERGYDIQGWYKSLGLKVTERWLEVL